MSFHFSFLSLFTSYFVLISKSEFSYITFLFLIIVFTTHLIPYLIITPFSILLLVSFCYLFSTSLFSLTFSLHPRFDIFSSLVCVLLLLFVRPPPPLSLLMLSSSSWFLFVPLFFILYLFASYFAIFIALLSFTNAIFSIAVFVVGLYFLLLLPCSSSC